MRWFCLFLLIAAPALAQATDPAPPRIGLVLSGGGAAGVAHVGVIRELEALGLRPDCVAGTSMGAIVGGLYAAGYGPDDLERVVTEIDWGSILNDASERGETHPIRRDSRLDPLSTQARLPLGFKDGTIRVAGGLVDGVKLSLILRQLTAPAADIQDFDDLPIPFRAVATDILTGAAVVMDSGDLGTALRASMSIPALFPPVERDGRVLVDGGVANNLPIDVVRDLCADVVIAVQIPPDTVDPDAVTSLAGSLGQTMSIFIHARSRELIATLQPQDVLLTPAVGAVGMLDFNAAPQTIDLGVAAVAAARPRLQALVAGRTPPVPAAPIDLNADLRYDRIAIVYPGPLDGEVIRARLDLPPSGEVANADLQRALRRVYGLDLFEQVTYRIERAGPERVLVVEAMPRSTGAVALRFGLGLADGFDGTNSFAVAAGASFTELDRLGARLDVDGAFGARPLLRAIYEQPLTVDHDVFLRGIASYVSRSQSLFPKPDLRLAEFSIQTASLGTELLYAPGDWGRLGLGIAYDLERIEVQTGDPALADQLGIDDDWEGRLRVGPVLDYDTLDDPDLPRDGAQLALILGLDPLAQDDDSLGVIKGSGVVARSSGPWTLSAFGLVDAELQSTGQVEPHFLGGFQRLSGFSTDELVGNVAVMTGLRGYRRFNYESPFGREAFAGASLELGGVYDDWSAIAYDGTFFAGSVFGGIQTGFGPLVLGLGWAETGQFAASFSLGLRF